MYTRPGLRSYTRGFGAITAESLTATGNVRGNILEFDLADASLPGVRCSSDTDVGIGRSAANTLSLSGGGNYAFVTVSQMRTGSTATEFSALGRLEAQRERRNSWRTAVDIAAVGTQVPIAGIADVELTLSTGAIDSTAAPFVSGSPAAGDVLTFVNLHATNALTLHTHGDAGVNSELLLGAATRILRANGGYLVVKRNPANTRFCELAFG